MLPRVPLAFRQCVTPSPHDFTLTTRLRQYPHPVLAFWRLRIPLLTHRAVGRALRVNHPFVFSVIPNPEPEQTILNLHSQRPVLQSDTRRSEPPDSFEVQGRVTLIGLE